MSELFQWFAQPGFSNLAQWIISVFALILSGVGIVIGVLNNRRERIIQSRLLAIEEERQAHQHAEAERAKIRAYLQNTGQSNYHIVIHNEGDAVARDVQAILDGNHEINKWHKIGPHSKVEYAVGVSKDCAPPFNIIVQWKNESGEGGTYETTLT